MTVATDLKNLKRNLKTEIQLAMAGDTPQSVVLLLREDRLPVAQTTDEHGCVTNKVISLLDLISMLDTSTTISQLMQAKTRTTDLPALPPNTLLASVTETPSGRSTTITGYVEPETYVFVLRQNGVTKTFDIPLPHIVYRAVYDENASALTALSIALCEPAAIPGASKQSPKPDPDTDTPLYLWPFSNVYGDFAGVSQGVCWPGISSLTMKLKDVPEQAVRRFARSENNADLYGRGLSHNAPYEGYAELLEAIERAGGIDGDYLLPTSTTVEDLHYQRRPKKEHP